MKKIALFVGLTVLIASAVQAQDYIVPEETWYHTEVLGSNYHGYVFNKDWAVDITVENQDGRFTPEDIDIAKAEKLMQKKLAFLNRNHENQEGLSLTSIFGNIFASMSASLMSTVPRLFGSTAFGKVHSPTWFRRT